MTEHAGLDPQTGGLLVSVEAWREMLRRTGTAKPDAPAPNDEAWKALIEVGATEDDRLHPAVARPLQAVGAPLAELRIERRGTEVSGWMDAHAAVLLVPRGADLVEVAPAAIPFLPDLVARLVELAPRPAAHRSPAELAPGALAKAIASPGTDGGDLPPVNDFWSLETIRAPDRSLADRLEVLDTDEGLWELEREQGSVRAVPTSPSRVWRRLTATVAAVIR